MTIGPSACSWVRLDASSTRKLAYVAASEDESDDVARANYQLALASQDLLVALSAAHCPAWIHDAAHTGDIEALRRIALWYAEWNNTVRLPALAKAAQGQIDLFQRLREWRTGVARQKLVPPYIIATESVLRRVADAKPATEQDLASVPGMSAAKVAVYGKEILEVVKAAA